IGPGGGRSAGNSGTPPRPVHRGGAPDRRRGTYLSGPALTLRAFLPAEAPPGLGLPLRGTARHPLIDDFGERPTVGEALENRLAGLAHWYEQPQLPGNDLAEQAASLQG